MFAEVVWVLISSRTQIQPQIILDPDLYLPDDFSVSYDYDWNKGLQPDRNNIESQSTSVNFSLPTNVRGILKI